MAPELICRVFCSRNAAHLAHWRTKSFAEHSALGSFYDDVVDALDKFVEAYMGARGKVIDQFDIPATPQVKEILKHLSEEVNWINQNREAIADEVPALENIVDEIAGIYLSTIYKLKQLS